MHIAGEDPSYFILIPCYSFYLDGALFMMIKRDEVNLKLFSEPFATVIGDPHLLVCFASNCDVIS